MGIKKVYLSHSTIPEKNQNRIIWIPFSGIQRNQNVNLSIWIKGSFKGTKKVLCLQQVQTKALSASFLMTCREQALIRTQSM